MSKRTIFVTGVSGYIGGVAIHSMNTVKDNVIAGGKSKAKLEQLHLKDVEIKEFNFADKQNLQTNFKGVDRLFLIPPGKEPNRSELTINAIRTAKEAGVKFILLFSTLGCERKEISIDQQFRPAEEALIGSGVDYTIVQSPYFQENILGMTEGVKLPLQDGFIPMISVCDIGEACAKIIQADDITQYKGRTYKMTGFENLTGNQMADALSKAVNRSVKYTSITQDEFKKTLMEKNIAEWHAKGIAELVERYSKKQDTATDHFKTVMGKNPVSLYHLAYHHFRC
jgi:NAD(P)H dehydrogenase (quinone)